MIPLLQFFFVRISITKTCLYKYIEKFTTKKGKFSDKKSDLFHIPAQKHRLWVLVRTDLGEAVLTSTTINVFSKIRKIMYTPVNPSFTL